MGPVYRWFVEENGLPKVRFQVPCGSLPRC